MGFCWFVVLVLFCLFELEFGDLVVGLWFSVLLFWLIREVGLLYDRVWWNLMTLWVLVE